MSTAERLNDEATLEERLAAKIEGILAAQSAAPRDPSKPGYWRHEHKRNQIPGVVSRTSSAEGAMRTDQEGKRVDVNIATRQSSVLGIRRPIQKAYVVTRWDEKVNGMHRVEADLDKGRILVISRAQDPTNPDMNWPDEMVFEKDTPEYDTMLQTTLKALEDLREDD